MSILDIDNLHFTYGDVLLYKGASMRLFEGEHIVLVGPNGSGKSTLLRLMEGALSPDQGTITWQNNKTIGYLDQYQKLDGHLEVKKYLYTVFLDLFEQEQHMEKLYEKVANADPNTQEKLLKSASLIGEKLIEADFYAIKSKVGSIIHGLGLSSDVLNMKFKQLSNGMRAKIILGKLLLEEADVLLLDEPTNFLDVKHIEWLEKFLNEYSKTFIVVTHHEGFAKNIARSVIAIENKMLSRYKGDYAFYLKEKTFRHAQQEKAFTQQQKFIQKTEDFIQKNITRAKTSKRAQSRRKMLHKMQKVSKPTKQREYYFSFPIGKPSGKDILKVNQLEIGYQTPLVAPLDIEILKHQNIVFTGENGIGKSTLLKTLLNIIPALDGSFKWSDTVKISYFEQDSTLKRHLTPFEIIHNAYPKFTKKNIMDLLATHGINYEIANRKISTLSGGEKAKTRLALLRHEKSNVLILDEPTNHLDVSAKEALINALNEYQGTIILVSHEPEFYEAVCDYEISLYN